MVSLFLEAFPTTQINYKIQFLKKISSSPTGHSNQIHKAYERQPLLPVGQSLQILHKISRNLSSPGQKQAKWRQLKTIDAIFL
jgi:hypothetical protein